MARSVTLATLLADLADACDDDPYSDSPATFVSKTRATRYLSQSVHAFALQHLGFGILSKTATFTTAAGTRQYALPVDFAAHKYMTYDYQGEPRPIFRRESEDVDLYTRQGGGWGEAAAFYSIEGEFFITNDPKGAYDVTVRYVPELPMTNAGGTPIADFSADTDVLLCKGAIEQWVVCDAAAKVLVKSQIDPSAKLAMREDIERVLKASVTERDAIHAPSVVDSWSRATRDRYGNW